MITNLENVKYLIDVINNRRSAKANRRLRLITNFIQTYSNLQRNHKAEGHGTINILKVLKLDNDEVRHSAILAWLLDAKANHGQGDMFFKAFIQICSIDLPVDSIRDYRVRKEFPGAESIIDVMAYNNGQFLIYIENKVDSSEGIDQCARELRDMHQLGDRLNIPHARRYAIFLTPDGREPITGDKRDWKTLSYDQLEDTFRLLLPDIKSDKVRYATEDWLEVISDF